MAEKVIKCWDCGSTIEGRHTALCETAEEGAVMDLPMQPGTQWWTGSLPPVEGAEGKGKDAAPEAK